MRAACLTVFLLIFTGVVQPPAAQEDAVTVNLAPVAEQEMLALWVEDVVKSENPLIRVSGVKIRLDLGAPVRIHAHATELMRVGSLLRDESIFFRVYRGDEGVGIFKYRKIRDRGRSPGKGIWLEAMPLDRDETFQKLTRDARESADIEALLSMDIEEAEKATRREGMLEQKIAAAIEREWKQLQSGEAFLVPTRATRD